jgi:hypothetical protein
MGRWQRFFCWRRGWDQTGVRLLKAEPLCGGANAPAFTGLTPPRFELPKQTKADWELSRFQFGTER